MVGSGQHEMISKNNVSRLSLTSSPDVSSMAPSGPLTIQDDRTAKKYNSELGSDLILLEITCNISLLSSDMMSHASTLAQ
jgi:hypothetical protein